jgi:hypothetical protein
MVFTHIPSSLCLIAAAFAPSLALTLGLLLVRSALPKWMCRPNGLRDGGGDAARAHRRGKPDLGSQKPAAAISPTLASAMLARRLDWRTVGGLAAS